MFVCFLESKQTYKTRQACFSAGVGFKPAPAALYFWRSSCGLGAQPCRVRTIQANIESMETFIKLRSILSKHRNLW